MHLDELAEKMWTLIPFDLTQSSALLKNAQHRLQNQEFRQAGLAAIQNITDSSLQIRNDEIYWLDTKCQNLSEDEKRFLNFLETLRQEIKNEMRVSLTEVECHFAFYNEGHYYQKHRDTTSINNKRFFSFVLYLNENWKDSDGGHLVGYDQENVIFRIKPEIGQMIIFRSDLEHEVMPTLRRRFSLTGWFRK